MYVEYESNNSGGRWWLTDDDWRALEKAGWKVVWADMEHVYDASGRRVLDTAGMPAIKAKAAEAYECWVKKDGDGTPRWLGAMARSAYRAGLSLLLAAQEWEQVTGKSATDVGCPCCGQPHEFTEYDDDGKYVTSGPNAEYSAAW